MIYPNDRAAGHATDLMPFLTTPTVKSAPLCEARSPDASDSSKLATSEPLAKRLALTPRRTGSRFACVPASIYCVTATIGPIQQLVCTIVALARSNADNFHPRVSTCMMHDELATAAKRPMVHYATARLDGLRRISINRRSRQISESLPKGILNLAVTRSTRNCAFFTLSRWTRLTRTS